PVLAELLFERTAELEVAVLLAQVPALRERRLDLLLDRVELAVGVGQLAHDGAAHRLVVRLLLEVAILLQALQNDAREIEDPVGRDLHEGRSARSSSPSGCRKSCSMTKPGSAATSAPIRDASRTWIGLRASATTIWVWKP